ncbi:MAG: acetylornithine/succinylornithine family transaminase [Ignavibacteria bacterium]|jgi:acetylornithine aminotransferase|nr:acetylornithine/succinylornithine family transaminase [Ignavibacteria bacterium]MCU7501525.1 acetylornithine/succinylornithine family transaminase [Ignavibacteria bacterium]MCU7515959.1 acetylornithine/succinylornithine family transaminase [Ignavibacteria bacterium]
MKTLLEKEKELFLPTYSRIPIEVERGEGVYLIDTKGERYLDFFSGLAVNALGYAHPKIVEAVCRQIGRFGHLSNNFITDVQVEFTEKLLKYSKMSRAFLANSGTEAIEGTIKLIRLKMGPEKKIYSLTNSFHGRTYGAMTLTAREKYQKGFEPLVPNVGHIEFNSLKDLEKKAGKDTAAIIFEFIQGEGGINEVSEEFIRKVVELRDRYGFIFVADAIQDGIGRSGKAFVHEYYGVEPDIIVTAKAIGGGLPLGAFLTTNSLKDVFTAGKHGTTFGGNPVSCAAGKVVLEEVFENGLLEKVLENGIYFRQELLKLKEEFPEAIKDVRGKGYMLGVELNFEASGIVKAMRDRRVLSNATNINVIRILPPLIATRADIDLYLSVLKDALKNK